MICKLCRKDKKEKEFGKAHGFSKFLLKAARDEAGRFLVLSQESGTDDKGSIEMKASGKDGLDVDKQLTCQVCDNSIIGKLEDYAAKALLGGVLEIAPVTETSRETGEKMVFEVVKNLDYPKMKLFVLSLLWRLSVSKIVLGSKVSLGEKHEEIIRKMLLAGDPGEELVYPVWISKIFLEGENLFGRGKLLEAVQAYSTKMKGLNSVIVDGGGFRFVTLVTSSPIPEYFQTAMIKEDGDSAFSRLSYKKWGIFEKWVQRTENARLSKNLVRDQSGAIIPTRNSVNTSFRNAHNR